METSHIFVANAVRPCSQQSVTSGENTPSSLKLTNLHLSNLYLVSLFCTKKQSVKDSLFFSWRIRTVAKAIRFYSRTSRGAELCSIRKSENTVRYKITIKNCLWKKLGTAVRLMYSAQNDMTMIDHAHGIRWRPPHFEILKSFCTK